MAAEVVAVPTRGSSAGSPSGCRTWPLLALVDEYLADPFLASLAAHFVAGSPESEHADGGKVRRFATVRRPASRPAKEPRASPDCSSATAHLDRGRGQLHMCSVRTLAERCGAQAFRDLGSFADRALGGDMIAGDEQVVSLVEPGVGEVAGRGDASHRGDGTLDLCRESCHRRRGQTRRGLRPDIRPNAGHDRLMLSMMRRDCRRCRRPGGRRCRVETLCTSEGT